MRMILTPPRWLDEGSSRCNRGRWETSPRRLFGTYSFGLDDFPPQILASPLPLMFNFPKLPISILLPKPLERFCDLEMCRCKRNKTIMLGNEKWGTQNQNSIEGSRWITKKNKNKSQCPPAIGPTTQQYGVLISPLVMLFECCALGIFI